MLKLGKAVKTGDFGPDRNALEAMQGIYLLSWPNVEF